MKKLDEVNNPSVQKFLSDLGMVIDEISPEELLRRVNLTSLNHPCKETCSGWVQGFEAGKAEQAQRVVELLSEVVALRAELRSDIPVIALSTHKEMIRVRDEMLERASPIIKDYFCGYAPMLGDIYRKWLSDYAELEATK